MLFMGIDIGTQGVRSVVVDQKGVLVAGKSVSFERMNESEVPGHYEQSPEVWRRSAAESIGSCVSDMKKAGYKPEDIRAIAIDGTSATVVPVDSEGRPLRTAFMYNDMRSVEETALVREAGADHEAKMGLRFNPSFALPRILWLKRNQPDIYESCARIVHQADYLVGCLTGEFGVSDYSNSLKTGYDLIDGRWPDFISKLGIDTKKLPEIIAPGSKIAPVSKKAAEEFGLSTETYVVAGATDGYASALAAGAVRVGDWASIIGTTIILKGVSPDIVIDPTGSSYSHKLPSGAWMVGGASNVGGRCLNNRFEPARFRELDAFARKLSPTGALIYPLTGKGERYPFVDPDAEEFIVGDVSDEKVLYAALLEGVGYTERLAYELSMSMGIPVGETIYTSGGACRSDVWLAIRASILNRTLKVPSIVEAAMGMALMAASKTCYSSLDEAAPEMISFAKTVEPDAKLVSRYDELYAEFEAQCKKRFKLG